MGKNDFRVGLSLFKKLKFPLFFLIYFSAISFSGQEPGFDRYFTLSFGTGFSMPSGNFSDYYKPGLGFGLNGGYVFSKSMKARLSFMSSSFPYASADTNITGGTLHDFAVKGDFLYGNFADSTLNYYGILSLGEHFFSSGDLVVGGTSQSIQSYSGFGVSVGGGVSFFLSPQFSLFGEAQFNKVFKNGDSDSFITFSAGASYHIAAKKRQGKEPDEKKIATTPAPRGDNTVGLKPDQKYGISITRCPKAFIPEGTNDVSFTAKIFRCDGKQWVPSTDPAKIKFKLYKVSNEPGHCLNFGKTKTPDLFFPKLSDGGPTGNDDNAVFEFEGTTHGTSNDCEPKIAGQDNPHHTGHWQEIWTKSPVTEITVVVRSEDYGAFGWIEASLKGVDRSIELPHMADSAQTTIDCPPGTCCELSGSHKVKIDYGKSGTTEINNWWEKIPRDDNDNGIADICAQDSCGAGFENAIKDEDDDPSNVNKGDGLTAYEEYRGFMINPGGDKNTSVHKRTSIKKKNVFIFVNSGLNVGDFALFNQSELDVNLIYNQNLIGAPGSPGQEKLTGPLPNGNIGILKPGSEIDYNRKSYRGLENAGSCAQHCIPVMKSDDYAASFPKKEKTVKSAMNKFMGCVTAQPPSNTWEKDIQAETDDGTPGTPGQIYYVVINVDRCNDPQVPNRLLQVVAHELGHAVNIKHHGEDGVHVHSNHLYFYQGTLTSGDDHCIMRYDHKAWGWCEKGCEIDEKKIHTTYWKGNQYIDPTGSTFCNSKTGTGVNSVTVGSKTITNDAQEGNCKAQIKVKDW
jgi:hypothetical protein